MYAHMQRYVPPAYSFGKPQVKTPKAWVGGVRVDVRIHLLELDPVIPILAQNFDQVIRHRIAALVACAHHKLLPALYLISCQVEEMAEVGLRRPHNATRILSRIN